MHDDACRRCHRHTRTGVMASGCDSATVVHKPRFGCSATTVRAASPVTCRMASGSQYGPCSRLPCHPQTKGKDRAPAPEAQEGSNKGAMRLGSGMLRLTTGDLALPSPLPCRHVRHRPESSARACFCVLLATPRRNFS
jgi:hypothetical protein